MPKKQALYYKNRPLLPAELSCVKKWINKMLDKSFIYKLILLAACFAVRYLVPISTSNWARYLDRIRS